jgi:prophage antirepressor-like protein
MSARAPFEVGIPATHHHAYDRIAESFGLGRDDVATDAERFEFSGHGIRAGLVDGEAWFVAVDVAAVLGYSATSAMTRSLDDDEKGVRVLHTLGGPQEVVVLSEPGLYSAIMRSRVDGAREFKRWVTHEVLPSIRRTGQYVAPETPEQLVARALTAAQGIIARRDVQIAELTPRAEAWDELADAAGDYAVADAASILKRAGVDTGPQRLFETLGEIRWTYRGEGKRWRPYATALDAGYLTERAMPPRLNSDGDLVPTAPQVRVTPRGLERLRVRLGVITEVAS